MRYALFLLFVLSSGCVLNQPYNFVYYTEVHTSNVSSVSSTSTKTIKETPAPPQKTVVIERAEQATTTTCPPFVLPSAGIPPATPVFANLPPMTKAGDDDVVLATHIKEMRKYVNSERSKIEKAYREWQLSCK
ncbi:hypothetical protein [Pseudomonas phage D6]|nr:hypothetical protein [Pseudomonas phage D6]